MIFTAQGGPRFKRRTRQKHPIQLLLLYQKLAQKVQVIHGRILACFNMGRDGFKKLILGGDDG
jgi:hypothetical protein